MSEQLGELRFANVAEIVVDPAKNPRGVITKEDVAELTASIRQNGVIEPVICAEGPEALELVAGYRRHKACEEAGRLRVPIYICAEEDRETYALSENMPGLRKDLPPIAEARGMKRLAVKRGFNQKQLAKHLGKDTSFVSVHLRMLRLPESVQAVFACGRPAISVVPQLLKIAKVSEAAAVRVAEMAAEDEDAERLLRRSPERLFSELAQLLVKQRGTVKVEHGRSRPLPPSEGEFVVFAFGGYYGVDIFDLAISDEQRSELVARIEALEEGRDASRHPSERVSVPLDEADLDALRALGVLLEYGEEDDHYGSCFCFDSAAVLDRVELTLQQAEKEVEARREADLKEARSEAAAQGEEIPEGADPAAVLAKKAKEERAEELKTERDKKAQSRRLNLELGRRLLKRRARRRTEKRRRELVRALALLAVDAEEHLAGLGPRLVYETWQKTERRKLKSGGFGAEKVTYLEPREARERLRGDIVAGKSLDEILDVTGDALVGAVYGSEEELAISNRVCGYSGRLRRASGPVRRAIDEEAKGVLPPELAEELKRSRERGYEESQFRS